MNEYVGLLRHHVDSVSFTATAEVLMHGASHHRGPFQLHPSIVTVGRAAHAGVRLDQEWVSRELVQLAACPFGWCARNGYRSQMHVQGPSADVLPLSLGAGVVLSPGRYRLSWPGLLHELALLVTVSGDPPNPALPLARDHPDIPANNRAKLPSLIAPARADGRGHLTAVQQDRMRIVFRHLLQDTPRPRNLAAAAAAELGLSEEAVKKTIRDVRRIVKKHRDAAGDFTLDELGIYLVHTTDWLTETPRRPGVRVPGR